jgi:hypothetical protein
MKHIYKCMLDDGNRLVVLSETDPNGPHIQSLSDIHVQPDDTAHNACSCDRNKNMLVVYDPPTCMHQPQHPITPCNKWLNEEWGTHTQCGRRVGGFLWWCFRNHGTTHLCGIKCAGCLVIEEINFTPCVAQGAVCVAWVVIFPVMVDDRKALCVTGPFYSASHLMNGRDSGMWVPMKHNSSKKTINL